ncbi:MAG: hypothetical protein KGL39_55050 [Patescibacteria group bacterium]|nr:hypothetical protein [Patescibacteria group bacterium]
MSNRSNQEMERIQREHWRLAKRSSIIAQEFEQAVKDLMVGQKLDGGGHIIERVPPTHSAIIKAAILLRRINPGPKPPQAAAEQTESKT